MQQNLIQILTNYINKNAENFMSREIVKIIRDICTEETIHFESFSSDYILKLEKNNRTMYIFGNKFPNNSAAIEQICNDKSALSDILKCYNIPHVEHLYFGSPALEDDYPSSGSWKKMQSLLKTHGKDGLVCKPNRGTGGRNVYRVQNSKELEYAVWKIFNSTNSLCISPYYEIQNEYRVLMVGDEVQYIFKKIRPHVVGNGHSTVKELWDNSNQAVSDISVADWDYIPNVDELVTISWKHNLGNGATPEIVTDPTLILKLSALAKKCVGALNLGFVSIDIIESNGELLILEINSGVMVEKFSTYSSESRELVKGAIKKAIQQYLHLDTKYYLTRARRSHFVLPILYKIAKRKGVTIVEDKEEQNFAVFIFPNGKCFVAKDYPFNINSSGSSSLSTNKNACNSFIKSFGYSVPKEKYFVKKSNIKVSLNEIEKCLNNRIKSLGFDFPMIVKPNDRSQGVGVFIAHNMEECLRCAQEAFLKSKIILLQEYCKGNEYRVVVLKGKIIQAYQRVPFTIVGDGNSTISELLQQKVEEFKQYGRDKDVDPNDPRVISHIIAAGYAFDSKLDQNKSLQLQDIANLSLGGTSVDVIDIMDKRFKTLAIDVAAKLNLDLCGIDIILSDITDIEKGYNILEVNSSPGLDNYIYSDRKKQNKYVESLYSKIFDEIGKL